MRLRATFLLLDCRMVMPKPSQGNLRGVWKRLKERLISIWKLQE